MNKIMRWIINSIRLTNLAPQSFHVIRAYHTHKGLQGLLETDYGKAHHLWITGRGLLRFHKLTEAIDNFDRMFDYI